MSTQSPEVKKILAAHLAEIGSTGGKSRSEKKQAAVRLNLEKARLVKALYRNNPSIKYAKNLGVDLDGDNQ